MPNFVFRRMLKEDPIPLVFAAVLKESPLAGAGEDLDIDAGPLVATASLGGSSKVDILVIANPLTANSDLKGNFFEGALTSIDAGALTATASLGGTFEANVVDAGPLVANAILRGQVRIAPTEVPPPHRVEIRDADGVLTHVLIDNIENLQWDALTIGGCKTASFTVINPLDSLDEVTIQNYDIRILVDPGSGLSVWWRGFVEDARLVLGDVLRMDISASGYSRRLERISVLSLGFPVEDGGIRFTRTDATTIARSLIDKANAMGLGFTVNNVTAPLSGFIIESIQFNSSIFSALTTLGQLAGEAEWGIDETKTFHFLAKTTTLDRVFITTRDIADFSRSSDSRNMINRINLIGRGNFRRTIENTDDLAVDVAQTSDDGTLDFGKATSNQRAVQTFTTTATTLSAIDLKIGKTGWGSNLVVDGDMELLDGSSPANWNKFRDRARREKDGTNPRSGNQALKVRHNGTGRGKYGVSQNITVTANQEVQFSAWLIDPEKEQPVTVDLLDGSTNTDEVLLLLQNEERTPTWYRVSGSITPTGTTVRLRIFDRNKKIGTGTDPFFVDDVSLQAASDLTVSVVERTGTSPDVFDEDNPLAVGTIPFEDIPDTPAEIRVSMIAFPLDSTKTYGVLIESQGLLSDSQYFLLASESTATGLSRDDGAGFIDTSTGAFMETLLPQSQLDRGVWSEVVRQPHIDNDLDAFLFGRSLLANRSSPIERASVVLKHNRNIRIEETKPQKLVRIKAGV